MSYDKKRKSEDFGFHPAISSSTAAVQLWEGTTIISLVLVSSARSKLHSNYAQKLQPLVSTSSLPSATGSINTSANPLGLIRIHIQVSRLPTLVPL